MTRLWRPVLAACIGLAAASAYAQGAEELAIAKKVLAQVQPLSFGKRREYCGYIGYDAKARLMATKAVAGTAASCGAPFPGDLAVISSYHTHGAFDAGYVNELPSDIDIDGDRQFYMNGFVATPGGRLWFIDSRAEIIRMICDVGCLPVAPGFTKSADGEIAQEYTYDTLRDRLRR